MGIYFLAERSSTSLVGFCCVPRCNGQHSLRWSGYSNVLQWFYEIADRNSGVVAQIGLRLRPPGFQPLIYSNNSIVQLLRELYFPSSVYLWEITDWNYKNSQAFWVELQSLLSYCTDFPPNLVLPMSLRRIQLLTQTLLLTFSQKHTQFFTKKVAHQIQLFPSLNLNYSNSTAGASFRFLSTDFKCVKSRLVSRPVCTRHYSQLKRARKLDLSSSDLTEQPTLISSIRMFQVIIYGQLTCVPQSYA